MTDTLLKKGTKQHADDWDTPSKSWVDMVLHLPYTDGCFGVTFYDITKDTVFYPTTSRFVTWVGTCLWLSKIDLNLGLILMVFTPVSAPR